MEEAPRRDGLKTPPAHGDGAASDGLLYAKLSPDGTRAAYVSDNNLYVEEFGPARSRS